MSKFVVFLKNGIAGYRTGKEAPEELLNTLYKRAGMLVGSIIVIFALWFNNLLIFLPMFVLVAVFSLFDGLRYLYYAYFGVWEEIVGVVTTSTLNTAETITQVGRGALKGGMRKITFQSEGELYSMPIPPKLNHLFVVGTIISVIVPSNAEKIRANGIYLVGTVLSRKVLPESTEETESEVPDPDDTISEYEFDEYESEDEFGYDFSEYEDDDYQ